MIPVVGRIPAGTPLVTYDDVVKNSKESIPVPVKEVRHAQCYFLEVVGDSMIDFGINDGDLVLIDPEDHEVGGVGRVMAVETKDGITLKTVVRVNEHTLRLISENARYAPTEVDLTKETVRIVGCVLPFMARRNPKLMS
jgi:repressor LexA